MSRSTPLVAPRAPAAGRPGAKGFAISSPFVGEHRPTHWATIMNELISRLSQLNSLEDLLFQLSSLPAWQIGLIASYLLLQGVVITVFPEEIITVTLGILWSQDKISFLHALLAIQAGLLPANALFVTFGARFGYPLIRRRPLVWVIDEDDVRWSLEAIRNNASKVIFATRFIPMIRAPLYFATGMSKTDILRFMRVDYLASLIQIPALLLLGRWIGKSAESLIGAYQKVGILFVALILWTIGYGVVRKLGKKKRIQA